MDDTDFFIKKGIRAVVSICDRHPSSEVIKNAKLSVIHVNVQDVQTTNLLPFFARVAHFVQAARTGHLKETDGHVETLTAESINDITSLINRGSSVSDKSEKNSDEKDKRSAENENKTVETKTNSINTSESISELKGKLEESLKPLFKSCFVCHEELLVADVELKSLGCLCCIMGREDAVVPVISKDDVKMGSHTAEDAIITSSKLSEKSKLDNSVQVTKTSVDDNVVSRDLWKNGKYIPPTGVYIHCQAGISRSTTTFCSYLMVWLGFNVKQALGHLHRCRECICPNRGFRQQLARFEQQKEILTMLNESIVKNFGESSELRKKDLSHVALVMAETAERGRDWERHYPESFDTNDFDEQERLLRDQLRTHIKDVEEGKISENVGLRWLFSKEDNRK